MKRLGLVLAVAIVLMLGAQVRPGSSSSTGQERANVNAGLPTGDWTLTCGPASKSGNVVDAYKVTTEAAQGLKVTKVALNNKSTKSVAAVRLNWQLFADENRGIVLLKGETPFLAVALSVKKRRTVEFPVVSFAKICEPLQIEGSLRGHFRIEVAVSAVVFDDKTEWKLEYDRKPGRVIPVAWHRAPTSFLEVVSYQDPIEIEEGEPGAGGCQHKECWWSPTKNKYTCPSRDGFNCAPSASGQSCTGSRC